MSNIKNDVCDNLSISSHEVLLACEKLFSGELEEWKGKKFGYKVKH